MRRRRTKQRQSLRKQNRRTLLLESLESRKLLATLELSGVGTTVPGVIFDGTANEEHIGFDVSGIGDVNSDGTNDLLIGSDTGDSYVVFGRDPATSPLGAFPTDLSTLAGGGGTQGFRLDGAANAGSAVAGASGDVNGDGIDDLIIGRPSANEAYVVFGQNSFAGSVSLAGLSGATTGFKITGGGYNNSLGFSVASGDVNGDGFADVAVGDPNAITNFGTYYDAGEVYIIFGRDTMAAGGAEANFPNSFPVSIADITFSGNNNYSRLGYSVGNAGDVDGDGFDDVIVGAPNVVYGSAGKAYVLFSDAGIASSINVGDFDQSAGAPGFLVSGSSSAYTGYSVNGAGDVNGDGLGDVLIGEYYGATGRQFVLFGTTSNSNVSLTSAVTSGAAIRLETSTDNGAQFAASGAGDFNGDGTDDLIVGARSAAPSGRTDAGQAYVVFGRSAGFPANTVIDLDSLDTGSDGDIINGVDNFDNAGHSVATVGDVNGDGVSDILIGAPGGDPVPSNSGHTYLLFGESAKIPITLTATANTGTEADETVITLSASTPLGEPVTGAQTIDIDVSGERIFATDYLLSGMTFNFADGAENATNTLTFTIQDDSFYEELEKATIALTNPSTGVTPGTTGSQDVDITDDEGQPTVNLSVTANTGTEAGTTAITVTATSSATGEVDQTVELTPTGTATVVDDFTLSGTTFTIPSGSTTDAVTFTVVNDAIVESNVDEVATLTLSNPSFNVALGVNPSEDIAIDSEDTATVSIVGEEKDEGTGGDPAETTFTFTVSLSAEVDAVVSATANTADGSAEQPGDYTEVSGANVTFPANNNSDQTVNVTVIADSDFESDEAFDLILSSLVNNNRPVTFAAAGGTETASATIKNDDLPTVELSVSANAGTEVGTTAITVTATASGAVSGNQTVSLGITPGAGITVGDYFISNTQITILDTQTSGNVSFTVADDDVVEALTETATLTISNPSSGIALGTNLSEDIAITDDDAATVSIVGESKVEGTSGVDTTFTFTVSLSKEVDVAVSMSANTADGTAEQPGDYTQLSGGTVTFPANDNTNQTIDVTVVADSDFEANETFDLILSSLSAPSRDVTFVGAGTTETGTATIQNDDASPNPTVDISLSTNAGTEADETMITVTATASAAVTGNQTVDVSVTGTGITGTDYTLSDLGTITILDNQTTGQLTFTVTDDSDPEGDETATIALTNPSAGLSLGTTTSDDVVITDNDLSAPPTGLFLNEIVENPAGTAVSDNPNEYIELRGNASQSLAGVYLVFVESDSEAAASMGVIDSGASSIIDLTGTSIGTNGFLVIVDDASDPYSIAAGTTIFDVSGLNIEQASYTALLIHVNEIGAPPTGSQDLDSGDDGLDALPTGWSIVDGVSVLDGGDTDLAYAQIAFSSDGDALTETGAVVVNGGAGIANDTIHHVMRIGDSTASTAADWVAIRFAESPVPTPPNFYIQAATDGAYEVGSLITNHLGESNPTSTAAPEPVNLSVSANAGTEADETEITVTVKADAAVVGNQTVDLVISGTGITGTDYSQPGTATSTVTILNGQTSGIATFKIANDSDIEGSETATLTIQNPSAGLVLDTNLSEDVAITDNDFPEVNLSVNPTSGTEDAKTDVTVTVTASQAVVGNQTVTLTISGTGITGTDYSEPATAASTVTILDGETTGTANFKIADDPDNEGTETAILTISDASAGIVLGSTLTQNVQITDNDVPAVPTIELSVSANAGDETGTTAITVTGTASSAVSGNQTVDLAVTGTNITGGDYTLTATQITINDGQTSGDVTFTVKDDNLVELLETATLTISNPSAGVALGTNLTEDIVITNNDAATVSISGQNKDEGSGGGSTTFTFTVSLSRLVDTNVTMTANTQNGSAVDTSDYTAVSGANVTFPANSLSDQTVDVTVSADDDIESNEIFDLILSSLDTGGRPVTFIGGAATQTASSTIVNDDFGAGGAGTVIENNDSGAGFGAVGSWIQISNKPQLAERDFLYSLAGSGENSASWSFDPVASGQYRIMVSYRAWDNRATNAPFTIRDTGTFLTTVEVDQTIGANATKSQSSIPPDLIEDVNGNPVHFFDLATINIVGSRIDVSLDNNANGVVVADAIRVERLGDVVAGPEVHVTDGGTVLVDGSSTVDFGDLEEDDVVSKTFTVTNFGTSLLTLTEPISLPSGFTLTSSFGDTTLDPLQATTFEVTVDTASLGLQSGQISFGSDDSDENPFNFNVQANVLADSGIEIIDNGDAGYSTVGNWTRVARNGHLNDFEYANQGAGNNVATFNFDVTSGQFEVFAAWRAHTNRSTAASFTIFNDNVAVRTINVDQTQAPVGITDAGTVFQSLGTVNVSSDTLRVQLNDDTGNTKLVIADAIRIARVGDIPAGSEIVIFDENGVDISDGSGVIDFGDIEQGETLPAQITRTLTVHNFGSDPLTLDPVDPMTGFTATNFGATTLLPNESTTFDITIDTSSVANLSDTLLFGNNDGDENPFDFTVQGNIVPATLIVDNGDVGFSTSGLAWNRIYTIGHQGDFDYALPGSGNRVATFTFDSLDAGDYRVLVTWRQNSNRTTTALHEIFDGDATTGISRGTASVNQTAVPLPDQVTGGSNFQDLGTFQVTGTKLTVTLTNQTDGLTIADAIQIIKT